MAYDEALAERLREALSGHPGVTEKSMFGGRAFLIDGHLVVSASGRGGLLLRVDPAEADDLLERPHARPYLMKGRELAGWLWIDADALDDDGFEWWVGRGVDFSRSLPSK